jgi:hypothetical protein
VGDSLNEALDPKLRSRRLFPLALMRRRKSAAS